MAGMAMILMAAAFAWSWPEVTVAWAVAVAVVEEVVEAEGEAALMSRVAGLCLRPCLAEGSTRVPSTASW